MRLRSSQFVFLLLLVCSVYAREASVLHLMADCASGRSGNHLEQREIVAALVQRTSPKLPPVHPPAQAISLDAAARAAYTTPWSMRRPALESTSVSSFTGFLRA